MIYIKSVYFNKRMKYDDSAYEFKIPAVDRMIKDNDELTFNTDINISI
ncbi:hypothetical protein ACTNDY_00430 [Tissierellaceae bacterium HCP3S3_D8]